MSHEESKIEFENYQDDTRDLTMDINFKGPMNESIESLKRLDTIEEEWK